MLLDSRTIVLRQRRDDGRTLSHDVAAMVYDVDHRIPYFDHFKRFSSARCLSEATTSCVKRMITLKMVHDGSSSLLRKLCGTTAYT